MNELKDNTNLFKQRQEETARKAAQGPAPAPRQQDIPETPGINIYTLPPDAPMRNFRIFIPTGTEGSFGVVDVQAHAAEPVEGGALVIRQQRGESAWTSRIFAAGTWSVVEAEVPSRGLLEDLYRRGDAFYREKGAAAQRHEAESAQSIGKADSTVTH